MKVLLIVLFMCLSASATAQATNCDGRYSVCLSRCNKTINTSTVLDFNTCVRNCEENKTECKKLNKQIYGK